MLVYLRFRSLSVVACLTMAMLGIGISSDNVRAAITWDSQALGEVNMVPNQPLGAGTQWWFNPVNWGATEPGEALPWYLPPTVDGTGFTDAQINEGTTTLPGGEGVVYDPTNDPHYADLDLDGVQTLGAEDLTYPDGYGPKAIERIYLSRNSVLGETNLLTIKGDLEIKRNGSQAVIVGRSGSTPGLLSWGRINQVSGHFLVQGDLDVGGHEASGWGNGIYDYRGGRLDVGPDTVTEIRLAPGSGTGAGGVGKFIMHNPGAGGYVRTRDLHVAPGHGEGTSTVANGTTLGVGIVEFHYENGGTRPMQIRESLQLNNGVSPSTLSTRSSRLDLILAEAPCAGAACVPNDIGLFDVDFDGLGFGLITGASSYGATFSKIADPTQVYTEGSTVSAMFAGTRYDWTISYTGNITWSDANNSVVDEILGAGNGTDVVLMGLGSEFVGVPGLAGDYNNDGFVNAADYTVWRNNLGTNFNLNGNGNETGGSAGVVDQADYTWWKQHYGDTASGAGGLAGSVVPEPGSIVLALVAACGILATGRRGRGTA